MITRNWVYAAFLLSLLLSSTSLIACIGAEQPPAQNTPAQPAIPGAGRAATAVTSGSPGAATKPAGTPSPTGMQVKPGPTATAPPAPVKVPGAVPGEAIITITGQVWDVASSARVIDLVEPVHGITAVAVEDKTEITSADGKKAGLSDVKPGMVIQALGQADGHGAVLASEIRILTAPSPLPTARPAPN